VINVGDRVFYILMWMLAFCVIALVLLLVLDLFRGAWEAIRQFGLTFLVGTTWDPVTRQFGTLPTVIGTLVKAGLALLLAVPISLGSAIFIAFYIPGGCAL
jgi:phosphate transport system permease protein